MPILPPPLNPDPPLYFWVFSLNISYLWAVLIKEISIDEKFDTKQ